MRYQPATTFRCVWLLLLSMLGSMLLAACAAAPVAAIIIRIQLPDSSAVLYEAGERVWYAARPVNDAAAQWVVEARAGGHALRNRASGRYLALDPQSPLVLTAAAPGPQTTWTLDPAAPASQISLSGIALHASDHLGYVQHAASGPASPRWELLPVDAAPPQATQPPAAIDPAETVTRIHAKAGGAVLYADAAALGLAELPASDPRSLWRVEAVGAEQARLVNLATGGALLALPDAAVQVLPAPADAPGALWLLPSVLGATLLQPANPEAGLLHVGDGRVQLGAASTFSNEAHWLLEPVFADGRPLPTATMPPAPTAAPTVAAGPTSTPLPPGARGASVPWIEYEAEAMETNGALVGPDRSFGTFAAEASGRQAVQLSDPGSFVRFTAQVEANALVLRLALPDAPEGGGITATLSLYVNDELRQSLTVTSHFAWVYGGPTLAIDAPGAGGAHRFFDETSALVAPIPAGASVMLRKDAGDSAEFYVLDLVDLELVAPPLEPPAAALALTDCGAIPDDNRDDGAALRQCLDQARANDQPLWIPVGTFDFTEPVADPLGYAVAEVELRGAGMWYSTLRGPWARFHCVGDGCRFYDFAVRGATTLRDDAVPENAFNGGAGRGSRLENVWIEHTKVGWWVGEGQTNVSDGLVIRGSRFRNLFADGVNLCNGTSNSIVEQSHFRNTGDDAVAIWSPSFDGPVNVGNAVRFNTVQVPWRATCYAIYGGRDNRIEDNLCFDVVTYPGILIAQQFGAHPFDGVTVVQRNSLIRAGGFMWNQPQGALKIHAAEGPLAGVEISDVLIEDATYAGVQLDGPAALSGVILRNIEIVRPGDSGIAIRSGTTGSAVFEAVRVLAPGAAALTNAAPTTRFSLERRGANAGW